MSAPRIGADKTGQPGVYERAREIRCRTCGAWRYRCRTPMGRERTSFHATRLRDAYALINNLARPAKLAKGD